MSKPNRESETVVRPPFRFHGSKFKLARWIISFFPASPRPDCYVDLYGGSGSVLLQLPTRHYLEIYNDLDGEIVNFFEILRKCPEELVRQIELTPYSKVEWQKSFEFDPDPLERARRFYIRASMNIAGPTAQWKSGWRRQKVITKQAGKKRMTPAPITFMRTDHLYAVANRFRGVQIESDTALNIISRYDSPETLFYADPTYPPETRGRWKKTAYKYEMTEKDHRELAEALRGIRGMAVISCYRCDLYDELYEGWQRFDKKARVNGPGSRIESIWVSPEVTRREFPLFTQRR